MFNRLKETIHSLTFPKVLLLTICILIGLNLICFLFQIYAFHDFYSFYTRDAQKILSGLVPYVHFAPYYPILADYYFVLFELFNVSILGIFNLKLIMARIIQSMVFLGCTILVYDIMKRLDFEEKSWQVIWFIGSPILLFFAIVQVNFDIFMVFFLLLALNGFIRKIPVLTGLAIGLGMMVKLFPIVLLIPLLIYYVFRKEFKNLLQLLLAAIGIYFLFYLPYSLIQVFLEGQTLIHFFTNFIDFSLVPLQWLEAHPLNLPYFFFLPLIAVTYMDKSFLKMVAYIMAVSVVIIFSSWRIARSPKSEDSIFKIIIFAVFLFFLFQPYISPWYLPWVLAPYYLIEKKDPFRENITYQPLILAYIALSGWVGLYFNNFILQGNQAETYDFLMTPNLILPMLIMMTAVLLMQFSTVLLMATDSLKWQRILIPIACGLLVIAIIGSVLLPLL